MHYTARLSCTRLRGRSNACTGEYRGLLRTETQFHKTVGPMHVLSVRCLALCSLLVLSALQDVFVANRKKGLKRRAKICRAVELHKYGFTDGCPECAVAAKGAKPVVGHSETCRQRIETEMAADDIAAARLLRARKRGGQFHGAVLTAKQAQSAAAAKRELALLTRAAAASASEEPTSGGRRRRWHKGP